MIISAAHTVLNYLLETSFDLTLSPCVKKSVYTYTWIQMQRTMQRPPLSKIRMSGKFSQQTTMDIDPIYSCAHIRSKHPHCYVYISCKAENLPPAAHWQSKKTYFRIGKNVGLEGTQSWITAHQSTLKMFWAQSAALQTPLTPSPKRVFSP